jgi:uncharacterized membrane protein YfcA
MGLSLYVVLGSAVVGLLVGLTGAGGGALMTPMLILLFSVKPAAAISSDLVAAVVMRPVGAAVHLHKGTVNLRMVGLMTLGSVPMAFLGAFLLKQMGDSTASQQNVEIALGAALLVGAAAMVLRYVLDRRSGRVRTGAIKQVTLRPVPTVLIGMIGGLIVGITSVGSGSLMIILLLFTYPLLSANQLVGTDLTQAVPLTAAAALGALTFGHVEFGVTASIIVGSVPAVLIGSLLSSRAPDKYIRPAITFVIFASGLKYVGVPTYPLGFIMGSILLAGAAYWLALRLFRRPGRERPSGRVRRSTKRRSGDRSARVLVHEGADGRQRGRDVLGRAAADAAVGLDDRGPVAGRRPLVGHREQDIGHLVAALGQVVAEPGGAGVAEVRPVRLEPGDHVREQAFHHGLHITGREGVHGLVGELDRGAGDPGLGRDLLLDQRQAIRGDLRLGVGREQDLLQRGNHGRVVLLSQLRCSGEATRQA